MMKAGLLGWLRFLPFETSLDPVWGSGLMLLGVTGIVLGMLLGVVQRDPRSVLAYSSIAKMGLFSTLIGFCLNHPSMANALIPLIVFLALHHLLVKPMLFMGLAIWQRLGATPWLVTSLILLALSLAALPLTGGGAAKSALATQLAGQLSGVLMLSSIAGVALVGRFLWLLKSQTVSLQRDPVTTLGWLLLLPVAIWTPFSWEMVSFEWKTVLIMTGGVVLFLLGVIYQRRWDSLRRPIRLWGERLILSTRRGYAKIPVKNGFLQTFLSLLKQRLPPLNTISSNQASLALRNPAIWWLLLMIGLLVALSQILTI
jgi:hypothetical protein